MEHVVSKRVVAGPGDPLPHGTVEAEFARHMARLIRLGLDEPTRIEERIRYEAQRVAEPMEVPASARRQVALAIEAVNRLRSLRACQEGVTSTEVSAIMGVTAEWMKRLRKRDGWAVVSPHAPRRQAVYYWTASSRLHGGELMSL